MPRRIKIEKNQEEKKKVKKTKTTKPRVEKEKVNNGIIPEANQTAEISIEDYPEKSITHDHDFFEKRESQGRIISLNTHDQIEQRKKIVMWTGVTFFMLLIGGFWVLNFRNIFKGQVAANSSEQVDLSQITDNLSKTMDEVSKGMNKLNEINATTTGNVATSSLPATVPTATSSTSTSTEFDSQTEIDQLKGRIEELEKASKK